MLLKSKNFLVNKAFKKILSLTLSSIFFYNISIHPALISGSLIKTPNGLVPIENLKVGDKVLTFNHDSSDTNKLFTEVAVTNIKTSTIDKIFVIKSSKEILISSKDQLFYDPDLNQWIKTENLTSENKFLSLNQETSELSLEHCDCIKTISLEATTIAYEISIESPHVFFISNAQILTHNFVPLIAVGLGFTFGDTLASIGFAGIGIALGALGIGLLAKNAPKNLPILNDPGIIQCNFQPTANYTPYEKAEPPARSEQSSSQEKQKKKTQITQIQITRINHNP